MLLTRLLIPVGYLVLKGREPAQQVEAGRRGADSQLRHRLLAQIGHSHELLESDD